MVEFFIGLVAMGIGIGTALVGACFVLKSIGVIHGF